LGLIAVKSAPVGVRAEIDALELEGYPRLAGDDARRQRAGSGRVIELHDSSPPVQALHPIDKMPRKLEAATAQVDKRLAKWCLQDCKR
jgi:hypothetical protein